MKVSTYAFAAIGLMLSVGAVTPIYPAQAEEQQVSVSSKATYEHGKHKHKRAEGTYSRACVAHGGGFPFYTDTLGAVTYDSPNGSASEPAASEQAATVPTIVK